MRFSKTTLVLATASSAAAQRPSSTPICDYYTTALLKNNTAENQLTLLTLLVNTVVIGNYTQPNVGVVVPGILAKGNFNGTDVNLLPYFDGTLLSTNRGGDVGVSQNFLDGGGAAPLKMNKPAADTTSSQYFLLTHLYEFFGALLGCSMQGQGAFAAYNGGASMYQIHSFMDLKPAQLGYFIQQVALAGASFGVTQDDLLAVGTALGTTFGLRCAAPAAVIKAQGPQLQAICIDDTCPLASGAVCDQYLPAVAPKTMNATATPTVSGSGSGSGSGPTATATMSPSPSKATGGAAATGISLAAAAAGFAALLL